MQIATDGATIEGFKLGSNHILHGRLTLFTSRIPRRMGAEMANGIHPSLQRYTRHFSTSMHRNLIIEYNISPLTNRVSTHKFLPILPHSL